MTEIQKIKRVLDQLHPDKKRYIIDVVFGEMLANPFLSDEERRHLEMRKWELLAENQGKKAA